MRAMKHENKASMDALFHENKASMDPLFSFHKNKGSIDALFQGKTCRGTIHKKIHFFEYAPSVKGKAKWVSQRWPQADSKQLEKPNRSTGPIYLKKKQEYLYSRILDS